MNNTTAHNTEVIECEPFILTKAEKGYCYQFYENKELIEEGILLKEPSINYVTNSLMCVIAQTGTGRSTNWGLFYDYSAENWSEKFRWILDYTEAKVIVGYPDKIVVRSIFDDSFYFEFSSFDQPISWVADSILTASFSNDESTVTVTYVVDGTYELATQVFSIM